MILPSKAKFVISLLATAVLAGCGGGGGSNETAPPTEPKNASPIAVNDQVTIVEGNTLSIAINDLLANDSDPNNDPITFTSFGSPSNGTVEQNAQTLLYTPNTDFYGDDEFSYTITDVCYVYGSKKGAKC